jgi:3-dehydroquinate synthase
MEKLLKHDSEALAYAIKRSCENKAAVVAADERESGMRALLNLGHTFGHAIETGKGYGVWLHGEAIAAGTLLAARLSRRMGLIGETEVERITTLYRKAKLPTSAPDLGAKRYLELMGLDKKVESGRIRFILLKKIGEAFITADVPEELVTATLSGIAANA